VPEDGLIVEARGENLLAVRFSAMASACEVLLPLMSEQAAVAIGSIAAQEAWRVEKKYSRYRDDSVTAWIQHRGTTIECTP
jgi:thiamine biosynthesis lipoprotein